MIRTLASVLLAMAYFTLVSPTWAADDPSCHATATQAPATPSSDMYLDGERLEFFSSCKDKSNIAAYCKHLTTTIRHKDGGSNTSIKYFLADSGPCKDKDSVQAYCKLWSTVDGLKTLIDEPDGYADPMDPDLAMPPNIIERSAKLCGTTREALLAKFCSTAAASKSRGDWILAVKACPKEGKEIYMHNCVGKQDEYHHPATPQMCEQMYKSGNTIF